MTQKFPFNHFLKLDGIQDGAALTKPEQPHPAVIEKSIKSLADTAGPMPSSEFSSDELKTISEELLEHIKNLMSANKFHTYFANTFTVSAVRQDTVEFMVTTTFIKKMVETHYLDI